MLVDFRTADAASDILCDICIIGGGAAGITLAHALIDSGLQVSLLESGGLDYSPSVQSLYEGQVAGLQNASPTGCRLRYFGGTTNHWTGWCAPLREIDFEARAWIPNSGWPISRADLQPYYERARTICQIGSHGAADAPVDEAGDFPAFSPDKATLQFFRFSPPTRFGRVYRESLERAGNVNVFLHANVLPLETNATATEVREVRFRTLAGKTGSVRARVVVLACGGMENARLLLLSNQVEPAGLGNASGLVGRFFMQHIEGTVARILAADHEALADNFTRYIVDGVGTRAEIALSAQAQEKSGILGSGFTIDAGEAHGAGYKALREAWRALRQGDWPENFSEKLWTVLTDIGSLGDAVYKRENYNVTLYARAEPLPNPGSRVSLGNARDAFGLPRIKVDWQLMPFDKRSLSESIRTVAEEFGRLDLGRFELADWVMPGNSSWPQPLWGGCHHMGTTRMSDDTKTGVVDRHGRVHSVGNLYVAGSSVFPTAGYVPPTLTIVALALRLADHLKQQFQSI